MSNTVGRCHDRDAQGLPPGDSLNGFTDALRRDGEFGWEHVRHEEAAAFAAAGRAYKSTPVARGRTGQRQRIAAAVAWALRARPTT
jgi:hypothetical protein